MKNEKFTIICENCGNKTALTNETDTFFEKIQLEAEGFAIKVSCTNCNNSVINKWW